MIQASQYGVQGQAYPVSSSGSYGARGGFLGEARQPGQSRGNDFLGGSSAGGTPGRAGSIGELMLRRILWRFHFVTTCS